MNALQYASALPDAIPPAWRGMTKFGYFFGLAAIIGGAWTHWTVVHPSLRYAEATDAERLRARSVKLAGVGALVMALVAYPQLAARVARAGDGMPFTEALKPSNVGAFLAKPAKPGEWIAPGVVVSVQNLLIVALAIALVPLIFGAWKSKADVIVAIAAPLSVAISLVGSLPTKALMAEEWLGKVLVQGHIIGGSLWVGGLVVLALLARERRHLTQTAGLAWMRIWERFGVLALVSVGMVLISGLWLTWREVGTWEQFVTTPFGRFLTVKILFVVGLVAAGAYNQLVLMPKIAQANARGNVASVFTYTLTHFPKVVLTEVVLGIGVLVLVPFLNGGARSQAAGHEVDPPALDSGLLMIGLVLLATMVVSFYGTAKASTKLGQRDMPVERAEADGMNVSEGVVA